MEFLIETAKQFGIMFTLLLTAAGIYKIFFEKKKALAEAEKAKAETAKLQIENKTGGELKLTEINKNLLDQMGKLLEHGERAENKIAELQKQDLECKESLARETSKRRELEATVHDMDIQLQELMHSDQTRAEEFQRLKKRFERFENNLMG